jgi:hypothetical protein
VSAARHTGAEPNFARLITEDELLDIEISAHALRRFVQRMQPGIAGAGQVADAMAKLEDLGSGNRLGAEQGQLNRYRDWMATHVEPHVLEAIRCEGFWSSERPRWSGSRTPSDGYLQVGGMCGFPVARYGLEIVLMTCTNRRDASWAQALDRGYTLMPKPFANSAPVPLRPPGPATLIASAWRSRHEHRGVLGAFAHERAAAIQATRQHNAEQRASHQAAEDDWHARRSRAAQVFRERHATV